MIRCYAPGGPVVQVAPGEVPAAPRAVWIDLLEPTREEEHAVEALLGLQVPTRLETSEIEESSRLYQEGGALVMTAVVINGMAEGRPERATVTFLLTKDHVVTVRYTNPMPFRTVDGMIARQSDHNTTASAVLLTLIESIVERAADVLEIVAGELNHVGDTLFWDEETTKEKKPRTDLQALIRKLGRKNRALAIIRESLLSLSRLTPFLKEAGRDRLTDGCKARLKAVERDLRSLSSFEAQMEQQISFLHEATVGLIGIEQNAIIKVFSVAAVLFLPPTLVGTVYGMNFSFMPELSWSFGYPFAILTMIVSAVLPYWWFKRRGWL